jgi:2,4-dienoyl-CoA reductase-like NADH-dependent reductase (Old Yellow Enzyme family)
MAVGLVTTPEQAQSIGAARDAARVALARALRWDPRGAWHAAAALGATVAPPPQYIRGAPREAAGVFGGARLGQR